MYLRSTNNKKKTLYITNIIFATFRILYGYLKWCCCFGCNSSGCRHFFSPEVTKRKSGDRDSKIYKTVVEG